MGLGVCIIDRGLLVSEEKLMVFVSLCGGPKAKKKEGALGGRGIWDARKGEGRF